MGGRIWRPEEEEIFWTVIIPTHAFLPPAVELGFAASNVASGPESASLARDTQFIH